MATPKNWHKDSTPTFYNGNKTMRKNIIHGWDHRETKHKVMVIYRPEKDRYFPMVGIKGKGLGVPGAGKLGRQRGYQNKKEARKVAVQHMRENPNP